jgi:hypothetical protein
VKASSFSRRSTSDNGALKDRTESSSGSMADIDSRHFGWLLRRFSWIKGFCRASI